MAAIKVLAEQTDEEPAVIEATEEPAVIEATEETTVTEEEITNKFRATRFAIRNPYTNVLYESDGEYEVIDLEDGSDSSKFIKVQLGAGVLTRI